VIKMKMLILASLAYSAVVNAQVFGEPVDCTTVTELVPIYGQFAQCSVTYNGKSYDLRQYIGESQSQWHWISERVYINGQYVPLSCQGRLDFLRNESRTRQVCKYKPVAGFSIRPTHSTFELSSTSRDYDGSLVSYQWSVDGQLFSQGASISLPQKVSTTINNRTYSIYNVSLTVTDNHGYQHTYSQVLYELNDECRTAACRNL